MRRNKLKIAIVGCGWLGESLAKFYLEKGEQVFGTTRTPSKAATLKKLGVEAFLLNSFDDDLRWLKTMDVLILNIPPSSFGEDYARFMVHIVCHIGAHTKVIFISSTSVYDSRNNVVDENEVFVGNSPRGKNVYQAEKELDGALGSVLTIIRMAGLVGKERHPAKFMAGKSYPGKEEPINLIHLTDCIGLIDLIIEKKCWGETINGCASEHPKKSEYYTWAANEFSLDAPLFTPEETDFKIISNEKSRVLLGYSYRYDDPYDFPI